VLRGASRPVPARRGGTVYLFSPTLGLKGGKK